MWFANFLESRTGFLNVIAPLDVPDKWLVDRQSYRLHDTCHRGEPGMVGISARIKQGTKSWKITTIFQSHSPRFSLCSVHP